MPSRGALERGLGGRICSVKVWHVTLESKVRSDMYVVSILQHGAVLLWDMCEDGLTLFVSGSILGPVIPLDGRYDSVRSGHLSQINFHVEKRRRLVCKPSRWVAQGKIVKAVLPFFCCDFVSSSLLHLSVFSSFPSSLCFPLGMVIFGYAPFTADSADVRKRFSCRTG
jgi:hypothetical protein